MIPWLHPRAAYIHVPFCAHLCGYCDFAVVAGRDEFMTAYVDALTRELATLDRPYEVDTIYIGGGTPTYLPANELERLLTAIRKWLPLKTLSTIFPPGSDPLTPSPPGFAGGEGWGEGGKRSEMSESVPPHPGLRPPSPPQRGRGEEFGGEWSIESTPDSLDAERVAVLADAGVTRVSIGVQSFREPMLRALDRRHTASEIAPAIERVRARIPNTSVDLIFGVPGQTLDDWRGDLADAIALGSDHLSCYGLTYEKGTQLFRDRTAGQVTPIEEDTEREMLLHAHDELPTLGYEHYEISNYAKPGRRCRHNEVYWANHSYLGFGLGAARYVNGIRELNTRSLTDYIARMAAGRPATIQTEQLNDDERARETITTQLRRREGVDRAAFAHQTGIGLDDLAGSAIARMVEIGLLTDDGQSIRLTREGLCVADSVLMELWRAEPTKRISLGVMN